MHIAGGNMWIEYGIAENWHQIVADCQERNERATIDWTFVIAHMRLGDTSRTKQFATRTKCACYLEMRRRISS